MRTAVLLAAVALVLSACGGSADVVETTDPANESTHQCAGHSVGGIEVAQGSSYDLPGGVRASLASTNMAGSPPTGSLSLTNVTAAQQDEAMRMQVGDTFQAGDTTYRVERLCQHVLEIKAE